MKIKLIAPAPKAEWGESFWDFKSLNKLSGRKASLIPLALPTIAALTPSHHEVIIIDENVDTVDFSENVDLVGITFLTHVAQRAYEIADEFRSRGIAVILGGIHVSMLPEEALEHADAIVIGEAENIWQQVLIDFERKKLKKYYEGTRQNLENSPVPRWDLVNHEDYSYFPIQTARGCPNNCDFCSVKEFNGRRFRTKPIENTVEELKALLAIDSKKLIFFTDDNLLAVPSYAKLLMKSIKDLELKAWWCQSSINRLNDDELLELMYQAGCRVVFIGIESVSDRSLDLMNKGKVNKSRDYASIIKKIHSKGIAVFGSFVLGSDTEDNEIFENTVNFINKTNIAFSMINILTPLPGTSLENRLLLEKRLRKSTWDQYNLECVCYIPSKQIGDLMEGRKYVLRKIYSYNALYRRLRHLWSNEVYVRNKGFRFSKGRILLTIKSFSWVATQPSRTWFIIRCLWRFKVTSISAVLLALNFHDYALSFGN